MLRILMAHNRYIERGGEDQSTEVEASLLRAYDNEVDLYIEDNRNIAQNGMLRAGLETIWSSRVYRTIRERLKKKRYDVVHIQNFFPMISPAIYYAAKAEGVSVVQTLRNYRLLCPHAQLYRDHHFCEDCVRKPVPWPGVLHACYRNSRLASAAVAGMISVHRTLRTWHKKVDIYIALTEFAKAKFIEGGLPEAKIVIKPNFVYPDPGIGEGTGGFALYVGRLSAEKGVKTLISAWEKIEGRLLLKIVGDGPLAPEVAQVARQNRSIESLGPKDRREVAELMQKAAFIVFPSTLYEGMPRTIIESFAVGTPVIASNQGSMAGLIAHGVNGLHFLTGDSEDLTRQIDWLTTHPQELSTMRAAARADYEAKYGASRNLELLLEIYQQAKLQHERKP